MNAQKSIIQKEQLDKGILFLKLFFFVWDKKIIDIDGEYLSYFRFADDNVSNTDNLDEKQQMLVGLKRKQNVYITQAKCR